MRSLLAATAVVFAFAAAPAQAQNSPTLDWRRADWAPDVPAAIGFTAQKDGVIEAVIVARGRVDRPLPTGGGSFRGTVIDTEIRCADRMWRIVEVLHHDRDYVQVAQLPDFAWAPLIRETPLHASITDVCDGGHDGPVGLKSGDVVEVQKWLDGV